LRFETKVIHVGEEPNLREGAYGDVVIPIHLSSTFARKEIDKPLGGYTYSRSGNPTRSALEKRLAALESAKFGLAFSSGMAAISAVSFALLKPGDHVVAFDDLYSGTKRLFNEILRKQFNIEFTYVDARDVNNVRREIKGNTKLIWLESPTNPLMKLCDIREISNIAREENVSVVVDNTFMSPYFQRPLELGADIVVHSTTKYLNGHSDSIGGAVMINEEEIYERVKFYQKTLGAILSPFDSYLVLRGVKTLAVRMERHNENALRIAEYLESHPKVKKVYYPGLRSHPQHELAKRQMYGFGGMLSFEIEGGMREAKVFLENLKLFSLAVSLGGVESLIEHPATMTHASISKEERERIGITDSLIRMSVGIENAEDLIDDLDSSLNRI